MKFRCPHCHNIITDDDQDEIVGIDENVGYIGIRNPETSHLMNEKRLGRMGTHRRNAYTFALICGDEGITADEYDTMMGGTLDGGRHSTSSSTISDLKHDGWLKVKVVDGQRVRRLTKWDNLADVMIVARYETVLDTPDTLT